MVDISTPVISIAGHDELSEVNLLEGDCGFATAVLEIDGQNVADMLNALNVRWGLALAPECSFLATQHQIVHLSPQLVATEREIESLTNLLQEPTTESDRPSTAVKPLAAPPQERHQSIFSLAKSVYETKAQHREQPRESTHLKNVYASTTQPPEVKEEQTQLESKKWEEREGRGDQQGQQQGQQEHKHRDKNRRHGIAKVTSAKAVEAPCENINGIFIRFMALMAKILGQAEAEAHELYNRIKHRTDQIDVLTTTLQKINAITGEMDISQNPQMQALLQRAREIGVEIPEDKTKWTEEEKRLLKENIQMRKDSMEKITQLERTDMQRYLQEA